MVLQDMPPSGGYPERRHVQRFVHKGITGVQAAILCTGITIYGWARWSLYWADQTEQKKQANNATKQFMVDVIEKGMNAYTKLYRYMTTRKEIQYLQESVKPEVDFDATHPVSKDFLYKHVEQLDEPQSFPYNGVGFRRLPFTMDRMKARRDLYIEQIKSNQRTNPQELLAWKSYFNTKLDEKLSNLNDYVCLRQLYRNTIISYYEDILLRKSMKPYNIAFITLHTNDYVRSSSLSSSSSLLKPKLDTMIVNWLFNQTNYNFVQQKPQNKSVRWSKPVPKGYESFHRF